MVLTLHLHHVILMFAHCVLAARDEIQNRVNWPEGNEYNIPVLKRAFEDFGNGRCGHPPPLGKGYGRGFALAFETFAKAHQQKARALIDDDAFVIQLLRGLEDCANTREVWGGGPRAALEMVALLRTQYPQAIKANVEDHIRNLHFRWLGTCQGEALQLPNPSFAAIESPPFQWDDDQLQAAISEQQLVVHLTSNPTSFLEHILNDRLTALSTKLLDNPMYTTVTGTNTNVNDAGTDIVQYLFHGPKIQEHGFLASNHDIYSINRLSTSAAEEACIGAMHKIKDFSRRALFQKLPDGRANAPSGHCVYRVNDFMQASKAIVDLGIDLTAKSDPTYAEFWFPRAPRSGVVGLLFHLPRWHSDLFEQIQTARANSHFSSLADLLLVGTDWEEEKHKVSARASFAIPSSDELQQQLMDGTLSLFNLRFVRRIANWKEAWAMHGEHLISKLNQSRSWSGRSWSDMVGNTVEELNQQAKLS